MRAGLRNILRKNREGLADAVAFHLSATEFIGSNLSNDYTQL
jgi:hypothetical protein